MKDAIGTFSNRRYARHAPQMSLLAREAQTGLGKKEEVELATGATKLGLKIIRYARTDVIRRVLVRFFLQRGVTWWPFQNVSYTFGC